MEEATLSAPVQQSNALFIRKTKTMLRLLLDCDQTMHFMIVHGFIEEICFHMPIAIFGLLSIAMSNEIVILALSGLRLDFLYFFIKYVSRVTEPSQLASYSYEHS